MLIILMNHFLVSNQNSSKEDNYNNDSDDDGSAVQVNDDNASLIFAELNMETETDRKSNLFVQL